MITKIFATGTDSPLVNSLIIYSDNTPALVDKCNLIFSDFYNAEYKKMEKAYPHGIPKVVSDALQKNLCSNLSIVAYRALDSYNREFAKEQIILTNDLKKEFCQILAERFSDWLNENVNEPGSCK